MITINEQELLTCKVNIKNHAPTISQEKQALSFRSARFVNNPHGHRRRAVRYGGSLEEGARGGVGWAKQNIAVYQ